MRNKLVIGMVAAWAVWPSALAGQPVTVKSRSGQFYVSGQAVLGSALEAVDLNQELIILDPALLAVSCDRIKGELLRLLEAEDEWQGQVLARINPAMTNPRLAIMKARRFVDGWQYRLELPVEVERRHLIQTVVEMLVMEMAQRHGAREPVELPPWLAEGLAGLMLERSATRLTLKPQITQVFQRPERDPLEEVKRVLQARPPLTLDELNWPMEEAMPASQSRVYRMCAYLMVHELLRLERGPECLTAMLRLLPEHRNWQTAFLRAFRPHFARMMDWDKWWSLLLVQTANRDLFGTWSAEESWEKFEAILATPVRVQLDGGEPAMSAQIGLPTVLREWEGQRQMELLRSKLGHLDALRIRASPEVVALVDDYREVLRDYLEERGKTGLLRRLRFGFTDEWVEETAGRLEELERRKTTVRRLLERAQRSRFSSAP